MLVQDIRLAASAIAQSFLRGHDSSHHRRRALEDLDRVTIEKSAFERCALLCTISRVCTDIVSRNSSHSILIEILLKNGEALSDLVTLLRYASPRVKCMILRTFRAILPNEGNTVDGSESEDTDEDTANDPEEIGPQLSLDSVYYVRIRLHGGRNVNRSPSSRRGKSMLFGKFLHEWLLQIIGTAAVPATRPGHTLKEAENSLAFRGVGSGYASAQIAAEAVMLFRTLLTSRTWRIPSRNAVDLSMENMNRFLSSLGNANEMNKAAYHSLVLGAASLVIIGGHCDFARVGGCVDVEMIDSKEPSSTTRESDEKAPPAPSSSSASTSTGEKSNIHTRRAVILGFSATSSHCSVLYDGDTVADAALLNPTQISVLRIVRAREEVPPASFTLRDTHFELLHACVRMRSDSDLIERDIVKTTQIMACRAQIAALAIRALTVQFEDPVNSSNALERGLQFALLDAALKPSKLPYFESNARLLRAWQKCQQRLVDFGSVLTEEAPPRISATACDGGGNSGAKISTPVDNENTERSMLLEGGDFSSTTPGCSAEEARAARQLLEATGGKYDRKLVLSVVQMHSASEEGLQRSFDWLTKWGSKYSKQPKEPIDIPLSRADVFDGAPRGRDEVLQHSATVPQPTLAEIARNPHVLVGHRVGIRWRDAWYVGEIDGYDASSGQHHVLYDDNDSRHYAWTTYFDPNNYPDGWRLIVFTPEQCAALWAERRVPIEEYITRRRVDRRSAIFNLLRCQFNVEEASSDFRMHSVPPRSWRIPQWARRRRGIGHAAASSPASANINDERVLVEEAEVGTPSSSSLLLQREETPEEHSEGATTTVTSTPTIRTGAEVSHDEFIDHGTSPLVDEGAVARVVEWTSAPIPSAVVALRETSGDVIRAVNMIIDSPDVVSSLVDAESNSTAGGDEDARNGKIRNRTAQNGNRPARHEMRAHPSPTNRASLESILAAFRHHARTQRRLMVQESRHESLIHLLGARRTLQAAIRAMNHAEMSSQDEESESESTAIPRWSWRSENSNEWVEYSSANAAIIEQGYASGADHVILSCDDSTVQVRLRDREDLTQINLDDGTECPVRRLVDRRSLWLRSRSAAASGLLLSGSAYGEGLNLANFERLTLGTRAMSGRAEESAQLGIPQPSMETILGDPFVLVGHRVTVRWRRAWYDGEIDGYDESSRKHHVTYDDGDQREYVWDEFFQGSMRSGWRILPISSERMQQLQWHREAAIRAYQARTRCTRRIAVFNLLRVQFVPWKAKSKIDDPPKSWTLPEWAKEQTAAASAAASGAMIDWNGIDSIVFGAATCSEVETRCSGRTESSVVSASSEVESEWICVVTRKAGDSEISNDDDDDEENKTSGDQNATKANERVEQQAAVNKVGIDVSGLPHSSDVGGCFFFGGDVRTVGLAQEPVPPSHSSKTVSLSLESDSSVDAAVTMKPVEDDEAAELQDASSKERETVPLRLLDTGSMQAMTIEMWVKPALVRTSTTSKTSEAALPRKRWIFSMARRCGVSSRACTLTDGRFGVIGIALCDHSVGEGLACVGMGNGTYQSFLPPVKVDRWHHIVLTVDFTVGEATLYLNFEQHQRLNLKTSLRAGEESISEEDSVTSKVPYVAIGGTFMLDAAENDGNDVHKKGIRAGSLDSSTLGRPLHPAHAWISKVQIYTRRLNSDEVKSRYTTSRHRYGHVGCPEWNLYLERRGSVEDTSLRVTLSDISISRLQTVRHVIESSISANDGSLANLRCLLTELPDFYAAVVERARAFVCENSAYKNVVAFSILAQSSEIRFYTEERKAFPLEDCRDWITFVRSSKDRLLSHSTLFSETLEAAATRNGVTDWDILENQPHVNSNMLQLVRIVSEMQKIEIENAARAIFGARPKPPLQWRIVHAAARDFVTLRSDAKACLVSAYQDGCSVWGTLRKTHVSMLRAQRTGISTRQAISILRLLRLLEHTFDPAMSSERAVVSGEAVYGQEKNVDGGGSPIPAEPIDLAKLQGYNIMPAAALEGAIGASEASTWCGSSMTSSSSFSESSSSFANFHGARKSRRRKSLNTRILRSCEVVLAEIPGQGVKEMQSNIAPGSIVALAPDVVGGVKECIFPIGVVHDCVANKVNIALMDPSTGMAAVDSYSIEMCRLISHFYGIPLVSIGTIFASIRKSASDVASRWARRALVVLLESRLRGDIDVLTSETNSFSENHLELFGGAQRVIQLIKLVVATENGFSSNVSLLCRKMRRVSQRLLISRRVETRRDQNISVPKVESDEPIADAFSRELVRECLDNFMNASAKAVESDVVVCESLHPLYTSESSTSRTICLPNAQALEIRIVTCQLGRDMSLEFYALPRSGEDGTDVEVDVGDSAFADDEAGLVFTLEGDGRIHRYASRDFTDSPTLSYVCCDMKSFLVSSDRAKISFQAPNADGISRYWGYRVEIRPLRGAKWENELQVSDKTAYCMQWGFWVLRLILDIDDLLEGTRKASERAIVDTHFISMQRMIGPRLCECMVRYLYTPCEPNKDQVIVMLSKLLRRQTLHFKTLSETSKSRSARSGEMLQLGPLNQLGRCTIRHVRSIMQQQRLIWPKRQLQLLVELAIATHAAEEASFSLAQVALGNLVSTTTIADEGVDNVTSMTTTTREIKSLSESINIDDTLDLLRYDSHSNRGLASDNDTAERVSRQGPWELLDYNTEVPALAFRRIAINWGDWRSSWSEGTIVASSFSLDSQSYSVRFDSGETHQFDDFRASFEEHPDWQWKTLQQSVTPLRCVKAYRGRGSRLNAWDNVHEYEMQLAKMQIYMGVETFERNRSSSDDETTEQELWWRGVALDGTAAGIFPASKVVIVGRPRPWEDMWTPVTVRSQERMSLRRILTEIDAMTDSILSNYATSKLSTSASLSAPSSPTSTMLEEEGKDDGARRGWAETEDHVIVQWTNQLVATGLAKSFSSIVPEKLPLKSVAQDDATSVEATAVRLLLQDRSNREICERYRKLQRFNLLLRKAQRLVDMSNASADGSSEQQWSLGSKLRSLRDIVFLDNKMPLLDSALRLTECSEKMAHFELDQFLAQLSEDQGLRHPAQSQCIFCQAFRVLYPRRRELFRNPDLDAHGLAHFKGSMAADAGGVFREALSSTVESVFSSSLHLLLPTPNHVAQDGNGQDLFVPNPESRSVLELQMFEFIGVIMGVAIRMKFPLPFRLPSLVWKRVLGQDPDASDLQQTDVRLSVLLDKVRHCEGDGVTSPRLFEEAFGSYLFWTVPTSADNEIVLRSKQRSSEDSIGVLASRVAPARVVFDDRVAYANTALKTRLHEFDVASKAMRRGLSTVVPMKAMQLFTWRELEVLVCGVPEISMNYLRQHTIEQGWGTDRDTVTLFWKAFSKLTHKERSGFVKFAWARERLPRGNEVWSHSFKLTKSSGPPDSPPRAHTCFFQVEMPVHTSLEAMEKSLAIAIASANQTVNMVEY